VKIGILSDTHNNVENLEKALTRLREEDVSVLIHCGDFTDPHLARLVHGFRVLAVFGNGDYASGEIRANLLALHPASSASLVYTGEIEGVRLAVTHGHLPGKTDELVRSGQYAYVFVGHSHRHLDQPTGSTRLINPGALGGMRREPRQFCLLDLVTAQAQFIEI
jgi:uncharacterized protein